MMTTIGKACVYVMVVLSLVILGFTTWYALDQREWEKDRQTLIDEIKQRQAAQARAETEYKKLLEETSKKVAEWEKQLRDGELAVNQVMGAPGTAGSILDLHDKLKVALEKMQQEMDQTSLALQDQKKLRGEVEKFRPPERKEPGIIDVTKKQRADAEKEQTLLKPELDNARAEVALVLKRHEQLVKRLDQLKKLGEKSGASAIP